MFDRKLLGLLAVLTVGGLLMAPGCVSHYTGMTMQSHPEPGGCCYYKDWDPCAETIEVTPVEDTNPVATQHVLIATVRDKNGKGLPCRRVEWTLVDPSIGTFVEVDESGLKADRGYKVTDRYAVTNTNCMPQTLTRGNDDPSDDIKLEKGQTWAVITSAVEGTSHVIAYAPSIYDWSKHKVFVRKHWLDAAWVFPPAATNPIGTEHQFSTHVTRASDQQGLEGAQVRYEIVSGPPARFRESGQTTAVVPTGADGNATVTLVQDQPAEGVNEIQVNVSRPGREGGEMMHLATGQTSKTWLGPQIDVTKSGPDRAMVGGEFSYTITISNPSQVAATNVQLVDTLPDGLEYVSAQPDGRAEGQRITWNAGTLDAGESRQATLTVRATRTGSFENSADVTADQNLSDRASATTVVAAPALQLSKTAPAEVLLGDDIPYTLTVTNTGDGEAKNVVIENRLPKGLATSDDQSSVQFTAGTLGPKDSQDFSFTARAQRPGTYTNPARATADGGLTAEASAQTIIRQPVLQVTKTAPERRFIGTAVEYQIVVTNSGDVAAENVVLTDTLPPGVTVDQVGEGGVASGGKITWNLGTLGINESRTVNAVVRASEAGTITNEVTATARGAEASARASTIISGIPAILLEVADSADPIRVGEEEVYVIRVSNQGSAIDRDIVILAILPPQLEFVRADGPTQGSLAGNEVRFAPLAELAPKQTAEFRVIAKGTAAGDARFGIRLTSAMLTTPVEETESTHVYAP